VPKQTGPQHWVKAGRSWFAGALAVVAMATISGCAEDHWYNSKKSAEEVRADTKACNDFAQENTLQRRGSDRFNYAQAMPTPQPRNTIPTGQQANLGETPMQLHDRVTTEKSFDRELDQCMRDKGYTLDKPAG
jgi:hypothetical protein